ncbi:caspase family protein [Streptomyces sp. NPDC002758]
MAVLPTPSASQALLIGVHAYDRLEDLPAVENNLASLVEVLTDQAVWGLPPANCTVLSQPGNAQDVLDTINRSAERAGDALVVYYAGHGLADPQSNDLYLALPGTRKESLYTALPYEWVRRALLSPSVPARRKVVILDCCYSGRALGGRMNGPDHIADHALIEGTYVLTACAETRPALAPEGEALTAFTGELVTALYEGIADGPPLLDMDTLYRHLFTQLKAKSRPEPQQRNRNFAGQIALARNRAHPEHPSLRSGSRLRRSSAFPGRSAARVDDRMDGGSPTGGGRAEPSPAVRPDVSSDLWPPSGVGGSAGGSRVSRASSHGRRGIGTAWIRRVVSVVGVGGLVALVVALGPALVNAVEKTVGEISSLGPDSSESETGQIIETASGKAPWTVRGYGLRFTVTGISRTVGPFGPNEGKPCLKIEATIERYESADYTGPELKVFDQAGNLLDFDEFSSSGDLDPSLHVKSRVVRVVVETEAHPSSLKLYIHDFYWKKGKDLVLSEVPVP